jgi:hypothetical protein
MEKKKGYFVTDIDKFLYLLEKYKVISIKDLSAKLNIPVDVLEKWAEVFELKGIINIKYPLFRSLILEYKEKKPKKEENSKETLDKKEIKHKDSSKIVNNSKIVDKNKSSKSSEEEISFDSLIDNESNNETENETRNLDSSKIKEEKTSKDEDEFSDEQLDLDPEDKEVSLLKKEGHHHNIDEQERHSSKKKENLKSKKIKRLHNHIQKLHKSKNAKRRNR